jgi:teichuronic acid biosynthesis glycosyltransferase TuaC
MRVLIATNMYPTPAMPDAGIFVQRQVEAVRALRPDWDVEVLHIDTVASRSRYVTGLAKARAEISRLRPDVIHAQYGLSLWFARAWRGPRVVTFHGSDLNVGWQRAVSLTLLRPQDRVAIVSETLRQWLGARDAELVPCGVDLELFAPRPREECRGRLGIPPGATVLGTPASARRPEKGVALFGQAMEALRTGGLEVVTHELHDIAPADMPVHLCALDALVLTSEREGSPVVTKEAICCGTRVASVPVGDVSEQFAGVTGAVVAETRSAEAVAAAVRRALAEPAPQPGVRERFSGATEGRAYVRMYEEALDARRPRRS